MKLRLKIVVLAVFFFSVHVSCIAQKDKKASLEQVFETPPESARPWVLWYWMHAAISKEGITADLEGLQKTGIGGVYLACIHDTVAKIPYPNPARQLSPEWWGMINHAMKECKRLGLKMAFHVSDGFALAGGPWIKPEQSMQKLVWTKTYLGGFNKENIKLEQPEAKENYYKDVAVFAYPANSGQAFNETVSVPTVTTSTGERASYLSFRGDDSRTFRSDTACWIQYKYPQAFTLRSLTTHTGGNNYQSQRLLVQSSDDGRHFITVAQLKAPRHGWQDTDEDYTFAVPETRAKYFRFVFDKTGTEAGSEDLDAAKWKPTFKIKGIYLSDEATVNQFEAKNGSIWRIAENTTSQMVPRQQAIPFKNIINLSSKMDAAGNLNWQPPAGNWVVVRIGHTSTGHKNATGGAAEGLECDKFDPEAIKLQFDSWFAQAFERTDPGLAAEVLKVFYIDSWEAGSQNWSRRFAAEFKKRRGYDLLPYLLVMTGIPIDDAATSEKILHDVRETIAELVNDVFYVTLRKLADQKNCTFTAENVAPTMTSDALLHFKTVDFPTGEFWLKSPTHDKPNDMFDAISAAHIYGKNIVQAEAFTNLRMEWNEHPGNIKVVGDRNFAMGINKAIIHVMTHNPWIERKPGMTLGSIGLFFQRDQTWYNQSKAWVDYMARVSALLQQGKPVTDIAVFIGEEVPRRSVLPDRLVSTLPGIFGKERIEAEEKRLANNNQPQRTIPVGVTHSANMADPEDWTDALRGYKYDCFNPDVLAGAKVVNNEVVFPSGASYKILVFPGKLLMNPNSHLMSVQVARKILELKEAGAHIIIERRNINSIGFKENDGALQKIWEQIFSKTGKGRLLETPYMESTFDRLGVARDVDATGGRQPIAWAHRRLPESDVYFISNQGDQAAHFPLSFRVKGYAPELWDPVNGATKDISSWSAKENRTDMNLYLEKDQSVFVVFRKKTGALSMAAVEKAPKTKTWSLELNRNWNVQFDPAFGGPKEKILFADLVSWTDHNDNNVKHYSGTAVYSKNFAVANADRNLPFYLTIDSIHEIATIYINGVDCGTLWTRPYRLDISKAIRPGDNTVEIKVSNTWANRLIRDAALPESERVTWTTAPMDFIRSKPLLKAGLAGIIRIEQ